MTDQPHEALPAAVSVTVRDRLFLCGTFALGVLLADAFFWHGPTAALTAAVWAWYALARWYAGPLRRREDRLLRGYVLILAAAFALGSNWYFRLWDLLALFVLVPVQLGGVLAPEKPWHLPSALLSRWGGGVSGLFTGLGAFFQSLVPEKAEKRRLPAALLGTAAALAMVCLLVPVLASADALFAAVTADLRAFIRDRFSVGLAKVLCGAALTPFLFSLLFSLGHPKEKPWTQRKAPAADPLTFAAILGALAALYLLFLGVQLRGVLGGAAYLAQRGISYAQWARSGFFQMTGVTAVNLTAILASSWACRPGGRGGRTVRLLAAAVLAESLALLGCAAWRMTLYVQAYGLSFKRFVTYWGMVMMALFLGVDQRTAQGINLLFFLPAAASALVCHARGGYLDRPTLRAAVPLALTGWLVLHCIPVDYLVARDQVDRYLSGQSPTVSVHYLAYALSYDTLSPLSRLDGDRTLASFEGDWWSQGETLGELLETRRAAAAAECADWRTWSLSAYLAARQAE